MAPQGKRQVIDAINQIGIKAGDTVLVHSDSTLAMHLSKSASFSAACTFLQECFEETLEENGTLLVPTFNYDFCKGKPYIHEKSPSQVGLFSNHVRQDKRAVRSFHPIYSFAAIGPQADALLGGVGKSSFGKNSVFERLHAANAKMVFFNVSMAFCTFVHYIEQQLNVEYRFLKYFSGQVTRGEDTWIDTFDFFVRYLDRDVVVNLDRFQNLLQEKNLLKEVSLANGNILVVNCVDVNDAGVQILDQEPNFLIASPPKPMTGIVNKIEHPYTASKTNSSSIKDIIAKVYPLKRALVSDGIDQAFSVIQSHMQAYTSCTVETYPPTKRVWTWRIPERFIVKNAFIQMEDGTKVADYSKNPLHLVSYSTPLDKWMRWEELNSHLHYSEKRPHAIPWEFKYYERGWGFCLSKDDYDKLPRDQKYHAVIETEYGVTPQDGLRTLTAQIDPVGGYDQNMGSVLICTHVCHPNMANDDASGVAVAIEIARRFHDNPLPQGSKSVQFLFCPETIGSIAYFSQHEELIPSIKGGIFIEMTGNKNRLALQRSRQDNHLIDRIARNVIGSIDENYHEDSFRNVIGNDEMVINGPGVNIPCISISRWPYPEYHTTDDNLDIIEEGILSEAADAVERILRIAATNYVPKRKFKGPVFLSGYGLWVDWRVNKPLNHALEKIFLRFEGNHSIFDIAEELGLDYWDVYDYVEKFRQKNLIEALPILSDIGEN
jgi:aminopeptidase-like protein/aminoglycoside N3'-acetyltransferase